MDNIWLETKHWIEQFVERIDQRFKMTSRSLLNSISNELFQNEWKQSYQQIKNGLVPSLEKSQL